MPASPVEISMDVTPLTEIIAPWSAGDAKRAFLNRFKDLIAIRN